MVLSLLISNHRYRRTQREAVRKEIAQWLINNKFFLTGNPRNGYPMGFIVVALLSGCVIGFISQNLFTWFCGAW